MNKFGEMLRSTQNKPKSIFHSFGVKLLSLLLIVGVLTGCFNGSKQVKATQITENPKTAVASSNSSKAYADLFRKINSKSDQNSSSQDDFVNPGGPCIFGIDLSSLGISGYADSTTAAEIGNNMYIIVRDKNSELHLAVVSEDKTNRQPYAIDSKTKLLSHIECGTVLKTYLGVSGTNSYLTYNEMSSIRAIGNDLLIGISNNAPGVVKTIFLVYNIAHPTNPVLIGMFGQIGTAGTYTTTHESNGIANGWTYSSGFRVKDDTVTLITHYTVNNPNQNNVYSYVPYSIHNEKSTLLPIGHIFSGEGQSNQYYVITKWKISSGATLLASYAFLGKTVINPEIFDKQIIVPTTTQSTAVVDKTYGSWQSIPKNLQTAKTTAKMRMVNTVTATSYKTTLTLYSAGNGALTEKSSVTFAGRLNNIGINLYHGNFRVIADIIGEASASGGYENANGIPVESNNALNDAFTKEGFPVMITPPDLSKYMKYGNALYILNGDFKQVGTIPTITQSAVDNVVFNGNTATLTMYNGKITLDLSDPAAPKVK